MKAYYNEFDPKAAAWLRELIRRGLVAAGDVDERSIKDVTANDLKGYGQVHLFAGIGGWSLALRLAGVPDTEPVWTGSCPCQPYSAAGKRKGQQDDRHLWPDMARLIRERKPAIVLGEQVASAIRFGWLDGVFGDMEAEGYACGAAVLGAHSVGSPHIRQRLFWVADAAERGRRGTSVARSGGHVDGGVETGGLSDAGIESRERDAGGLLAPQAGVGGSWSQHGNNAVGSEHGGATCGLSDADESGLEGRGLLTGERPSERAARPASVWDRYDIIPFRDGKTRRIEPGLAPLADGVPARVVRLRGYGNAIVPQVAAAFVEEVMEAAK